MTTPTPFTPYVFSKYQLAVFDAVAAADTNIQVNAVAGSGKSFTLEHACQRIPRGKKVIALAFNKSIAEELQRRIPDGAVASTLNSVGHRTWGSFLKASVDGSKTRTIARETVPFHERDLTSDVTSLVTKAKVHGLVPNAAIAASEHRLVGLMADTDENWLNIAGRYGIELPWQYARVLELARQVLTKSVLRTAVIDFDDQLYMPIIYGVRFQSYDWVLVDEAQDLSDIQMEMIKRMGSTTTRYLFVGDRRQCQPAGTMVTMALGHRKDIKDIKEGDYVASYDRRSNVMVAGREHGKGRPPEGKKITGTASRPYSGRMLRVETPDGSTEATPDHIWVARWTERKVGPCVAYVMRKGQDFRVGWCQLFADRNDSDSSFTNHFFHRCRLEDADEGWILEVFEGRTDASVTESVVAAKYGLPTATFREVDGAQHMTAPAIERIFASVREEASDRARRALESFGRDINLPFYTKDSDRSRTTVFEVHTANIIPSMMSIPKETGCRDVVWTPVSGVSSRHFEGLVYSLKVDDTETYIADGLVTHNCLYAFRGADSKAMDRIQKEFSCKELPLSVTYRCPKLVVERAKQYEPTIEARENAPDGVVREGGFYLDADYKSGDMVICRRTVPVIALAYTLISRRIKCRVQGRDLAEGVKSLVRKLRAKTVEQLLQKLNEWETRQIDLLVAADADEQKIEQVKDKAATLRTIVQSSGATTVEQVEQEIDSLFSGDGPCVLLSTVHRAKGLEADRVFVIDHHVTPKYATFSPEALEQETNIKYVAVTRAKSELVFVTTAPPKAEPASAEAEQKPEVKQIKF